MADDLRQKLINLYATHDMRELQDKGELFTNAFGTGRDAFVNNNEFTELNQIVKDQKLLIEAVEERYKKKTGAVLGDRKEQVVQCLKLLLNRAVFNKVADTLYTRQMGVLYDLMLARYAKAVPPWPDSYTTHFEFLYPKIRDWKLFFFSYTNEGAEIINNEYKALIQNLIETKKLPAILQSTTTQRDNNLLAEVVIQQLIRNNLPKGFYDKTGIKPGDKLDRIRAECSSSFLFIQLVTRDSLVFRDTNWPFTEYMEFKNANDKLAKDFGGYAKVLEKRFLFTLAGGRLADLKPQGLQPDDYDDWLTHISQVHYEAPPNDAQLFQAAIDKIATSVRTLIEMDWIQAVSK